MRRRRGRGTDPRDIGVGSSGGRLSRFRRGGQATPPAATGGGPLSRFRRGGRAAPAAESGGGGGCCLWPFMLTVAVGGGLVARAAGRRGGRHGTR